MAAQAKSKVSEICQPLEGSGLLDKPIPISLLDEIAYHLEDWEELAPYIELTQAEENEIRNDYDKQYLLQKRQALRRWREKTHLKATLENFVSILCDQGLVSLAEMVVKKSQMPPLCLSIFAKYLRHFYKHDFHHPASNQWPSLLESFDLPALYVDLKFHKVPINETKGAQNKPVEVELNEVFEEKGTTKRLLILFEGIAGSGKTTLSWHACREWADEKLLQQFDLLIHVQVNAPRFQNASSLRDLIPDPVKEARDEIAQAITDREGKGVCVLLEGLDEASKSLRDFVLSKLLRNSSLSHLSIIITSRPDSGLLLSLQWCLNSKVVLNGFTNESLCQFLDSTMKTDKISRGELNKMFSINPRFEALCTLPINAVIVSFLVQCFGHELPVTQTGLFKLLVCHICIRHIQLRSGGTDLHIEKLPYDLPCDLRESFDKLCLLAYTASVKKKRALDLTDLRQVKFTEDDDKLGFLHVSQTKSMYGLSKSFIFLHFTLQQFLAAIHLSQQKNKKQISFISRAIEEDPLNELLPFLAGLASGQIRTDIIEHLDCKMSLDDESIAVAVQNDPRISHDPRRKFLALCRCIYECQSESLIEHVKLFNVPVPLSLYNILLKAFQQKKSYISFRNTWLSPLECLSVAYFIRYQSMTLNQDYTIQLNLANSSISDTSLSILATELRVDEHLHCDTPCKILLGLGDNAFHYQSLQSLKNLIKGRSNIHSIQLSGCFNTSGVDKKIVLKHLIEGLNCNSSCCRIGLGENGLNQSHVYHLVLLIMSCPQLCNIDLSFCSLTLPVFTPLLSKALSLSMVMYLQLGACDISDEVLLCLGKGLSQNCSLRVLNLISNPITLLGFIKFVNLFVNETSTLSGILTDSYIYDGVYGYFQGREVLTKINNNRKRRNMLDFVVESPLDDDPVTIEAVDRVSYLESLNSRSRKQ